jgi:hypothetical protein
MAVEILRISQWVLGLLHFDAIRLYLGLTELFFLLLLPRMRPRFLILHLTIVYLPSVLNSNEFFPSLVLHNPTHITLDIWVLLLVSVFLLLVITLFFKLILIRFYVRQKNSFLLGLGDIFISPILLLTVAFFKTLFELVPPLFSLYVSVSVRSNRTFLGNPISSDYSPFLFTIVRTVFI